MEEVDLTSKETYIPSTQQTDSRQCARHWGSYSYHHMALDSESSPQPELLPTFAKTALQHLPLQMNRHNSRPGSFLITWQVEKDTELEVEAWILIFI